MQKGFCICRSSGYTKGVWCLVMHIYLGRICSAGLRGVMSGLLAGSAQLAPGPDPSGSVGHLPVPSGFKPLWCLHGPYAVQVLLTGPLNIKEKKSWRLVCPVRATGAQGGNLWESWSSAPHCLELLPPSLQTPCTDRTFKQAPGKVLTLQVPWCHL